MSRFIQKFKRKWGSDDQGRALDAKPGVNGAPSESASDNPPPALQSETPQMELEGTPPVSPRAVEIESIFTGLHLNPQIQKREGRDSPYLRRTTPEQMSGSSFSDSESTFEFISSKVGSQPSEGELTPLEGGGSKPPPLGEGEPKSPFSFINEDEASDKNASESKRQGGVVETTPSGFGFIASEENVEASGQSSETKQEATSLFSFLNPASTSGEDSTVAKQPKQEDLITQGVPSSPQTNSNRPGSRPSSAKVPQTAVSMEKHESLHSISSKTKPKPLETFSTSPSAFSFSPPPLPQGMSPFFDASSPDRNPRPLKSSVGKQQPPSGKKKKKLKATRPGQERADDGFGGTLEASSLKKDLDSLSIGSQTSSLDGNRDKDSASISSSTSELQKILAEETRTREDPIEHLHREPSMATEDESVVPAVVTKETNEDAGEKKKAEKRDLLPKGEREVSAELVDISTAAQSENSVESESQRKQEEALPGDSSAADGGGHTGSESERLLAEVFSVDGTWGSANYEVELTPADRLTATLQSSESNLANIRSSLSDSQQEYMKTLEGYLTDTRQQIERRAHAKELKSQEAKALSEEDYELAEELSRELESISLSQEWTIAALSQTTLQEWVRQCLEQMGSEVNLQQDFQRQLGEMREEQTTALEELDKEFSFVQAKEKMKRKTMEDKIERERGHIALDKEHLEKREQLFQEEVDRRCAEFVTNKKKLDEEHKSIQSEIAALEAKLFSLREQEGRVLGAIGEEEGKISAVHEELSSEDSQLGEERSHVERQEAELQKEVDNLDEVKRTFELAQQEQQSKKQSITEQIETMSQKITKSQERADTLKHSMQEAESLVSMDTSTVLKPSEQLQSLQEQYRSKDSEMRTLTSQVLSLQSDVSALRKKIANTETQLPQMEEAKKVAVAARQYKEASRISSETKALRSSVERERERVGEMEGDLTTKNQQLSALSETLNTIGEELSNKQREEDEEHIKHLMESMAALKARIASISETESPLFGVLQHWCRLHRLLAEDLCTKHDLQLSDFLTEEETTTLAAESSTTGPQVEPESDQEPPVEERTPGVGMELAAPSVDPSSGEKVDPGKAGELRERIAQLVTRIEEACKEEDYDLAAELDEELKQLQETLGE